MTEKQIKTKYGRYAIKATTGYKNKALKIVNDVYRGKERFTIEIFNECYTETAVDNKRRELIMSA